MRPPHRFPFELIDREAANSAEAALSAASWWLRGEAPMTLPLLVEATAQAAARLSAPPDAPEPERLALAGIETAELLVPPVAGDALTIEVRLVARLGGVVKVEGEIRRAAELVARIRLTLSSAPA